MVNLVAHFEPSKLADFMNFIGLLIHKLQVSTGEPPQIKMFDLLNKLIRNANIRALLIAL